MNKFEARPSPELSFFLGAWIGDGWADENDGGKRLLLKVRSYDFAKEFADSAKKVLQKRSDYWVRRVNGNSDRWYLVKVTSVMLFAFVNQPLAKLSKFIRAFPASFLRGFYTAEGNPSITLSSRSDRLDVCVCITNTDLALMETSRSMLIQLGFRPGRVRIDKDAGEPTNLSVATKPIYQFYLSGFKDVCEFAIRIGFADSAKQSKLNDAIGMIRTSDHFEAARLWRQMYGKSRNYWERATQR